MPHAARLSRLRFRTDPRVRFLVLGGLAVFVVITYLLIVLGVGVLVGRTDSPDLGLSLLATAVVALGFEPVQIRLERRVTRMVNDGRPSPYDVLSRFSEAVTASQGGEDVPARMAQVLVEGTGVLWAQVWLADDDGLVLAATYPPLAGADLHPPSTAQEAGRRTHAVLRAREPLGVLRIREQPGRPLTPVEDKLFAGLAAQSGVVLHGVRLRAQLARRAAELSGRAEELRISRERLVEAQDAARRRLERDIHDGAQQHLVALAVNLRLAETLTAQSSERASDVLAAQYAAAGVATDTLKELARGIYPRDLGTHGIGTALRNAVMTSPVRVVVTDDGCGRHSRAIEAAVYFCSLEAVQNAVKHAGATGVVVAMRAEEGLLKFTITDDGRGFDVEAVDDGVGLTNMRDRVDSLGGTMRWVRLASGGTRVAGQLPSLPVETRVR